MLYCRLLTNTLGKSIVLSERSDVADVEALSEGYGFVADAKVFRLSRTAKNQKDFKIGAMNGWKHGKPYAMVVCPIYQLPGRNSQIYKQAITQNVCIFTYSHLSLLLKFAQTGGFKNAQHLLLQVFKTVPALNPSKSAVDYWLAINKTILNFSEDNHLFWEIEKKASSESIQTGKEEALVFLASQREKIMGMSHEEAIKALVKASKIESKIKMIQSMISDNGLFAIK